MAEHKGFLQRIQYLLISPPLLLLIALILLVEFILYLLLRSVFKILEVCQGALKWNQEVKRKMYRARDYQTWCEAAMTLDEKEGNNLWKQQEESTLYDSELIKELTQSLYRYRKNNDLPNLMKILSTIFSNPNNGGIHNELLYMECHFGTKYLIEDFFNLILDCIMLIRDSKDIEQAIKTQFFRRACKAYGRTALILSGGAAMGYFHLGVLKCLNDCDSIPRVISGASAGSLISAFIAVRTPEEIRKDLTYEIADLFTPAEEPFFTKFFRYITRGHIFDADLWIPKCQLITKGDITFLEAFEKTGRILNIVTTSTSKYTDSLMCNYKTTPHVVIWSAVLASSAMPALLQAVELIEIDPITKERITFHYHGKTWRDGTIKMDIPQKMLQKQHNVHFLVASQVNPHAMPFFFNQRGNNGMPSQHRSGSQFRGGIIMAIMEKFLKLEMRKWLMLIGELDLLPNLFGSDWRFIFTQDLTGTVTIVPRARIYHYLKLLSDPSREDMKDYIWRGERATWSILPRILNRYRIEKLLNDSYDMIKQQEERLSSSSFAGGTVEADGSEYKM